MNKAFLRVQSRRFLRYLMNHLMSEIDEDDLGRSAIIFSPHQDDETLGCGGTIIQKKMKGADLTIVFMTDGSRSHRNLISKDMLKAIRAKEALEASRMLGLEKNDIIFLEFENGKLGENQNSAVSRVVDILVDEQPEEIFVPYYKEPRSWSEDHHATNTIVVSAAKVYGRRLVVNEYPIGFWCHWPWVKSTLTDDRWRFLTFWFKSLISGLSLLRDFRSSVNIGDVLERKRLVLDQYKSQMTRLIPNPHWNTLSDVSNGEFLECFFQEYEIFRSYNIFGKKV